MASFRAHAAAFMGRFDVAGIARTGGSRRGGLRRARVTARPVKCGHVRGSVQNRLALHLLAWGAGNDCRRRRWHGLRVGCNGPLSMLYGILLLRFLGCEREEPVGTSALFVGCEHVAMGPRGRPMVSSVGRTSGSWPCARTAGRWPKAIRCHGL